MNAALELREVRVRRRGAPILDGVGLQVAEGEIVALLGPSGAGKTTLLQVALGLVAADEGEVRIGGVVATSGRRIVIPPSERRLGMVFQDLALWPHLTVAGNLAFVLRARGVAAAARADRIEEMLRAVGLADKADRHPGELSGGERQRAAIARALAGDPRTVLLDEPLSNLDVALRRELLALFRQLLRERGRTALHVTHDLREAVAIADRVVVLERGRVVQDGPLDALRSHPATDFVRALLDDLGRPSR